MPAAPRMYLIVMYRPLLAAPLVVRCMYTCGSMLKVYRDSVAAGEERLASCAAEKSKYFFIYTVTIDPFGGLLFTSRGRWQCRRGDAD
jgi:hypothetical protein